MWSCGIFWHFFARQLGFHEVSMMLTGRQVLLHVTFFAAYKVTNFTNKIRHFSQSRFGFPKFPIYEKEKSPKPFSYNLWKMFKILSSRFFRL